MVSFNFNFHSLGPDTGDFIIEVLINDSLYPQEFVFNRHLHTLHHQFLISMEKHFKYFVFRKHCD